jgi:uncharacterized protein
MKGKKIIITGGTGFIGQAFARYFGKDNHVILLSRQSVNGNALTITNKRNDNNYNSSLVRAADGYNVTYWRWDGVHVEKHWASEFEGADIVINLAGRSVNCRYNEANKTDIFDSRTNATVAVGGAIRACKLPPSLWINMSSATVYQHTFDAPNDEWNGKISDLKNDNMPYSFLDRIRFGMKRWWRTRKFGRSSQEVRDLDLDFSVQVVKRWEKVFFEQTTPHTRKIAMRTAITLGNGGVMVPYFNLAKFGLGGRQGNGKQMYSWIHVEDLARSIDWFFEHKQLEGVFNCAAPGAVTNAGFMRAVREITGHKLGLPAFDWMLEMGAAVIGTETELLLKSRWVAPSKLLASGFVFKYPELQQALSNIVEKTPRRQYHLF